MGTSTKPICVGVDPLHLFLFFCHHCDILWLRWGNSNGNILLWLEGGGGGDNMVIVGAGIVRS